MRQSLSTQLVLATERQAFTEDATALTAVDNGVSYSADLTTITSAAPSSRTVFVDVSTTSTADDTVVLGARSTTGRCFWIQASLRAETQFAANDCAGVPAVPELRTDW